MLQSNIEDEITALYPEETQHARKNSHQSVHVVRQPTGKYFRFQQGQPLLTVFVSMG